MENKNTIPQTIDPEEFLYRGVVEKQWDKDNNRPTSAAFKCSSGVSVNRDIQMLDLNSCVNALLEMKPFKAICRIKDRAVREVEAITKYLPVPGNDYHCEIHDSEQKVTLSGRKPNKLRDRAEVVYTE
jgi:hypothetical protein